MSSRRLASTRLSSASAALALVALSAFGSCSSHDPGGNRSVAIPAARTDELPQLFTRARETNKGFERVQEVERFDRISVIRFSTNYWGGASDAFSYGVSCLAELSLERGYSHFVVLDECARRLGVAPELGNDWQVVIGFLGDPDVDPRDVFTPYDLSKRDCRVWPAARGASPMPGPIGTDLWEVFTRPHWNFGGRAAAGPDDEDWPQLCDDV